VKQTTISRGLLGLDLAGTRLNESDLQGLRILSIHLEAHMAQTGDAVGVAKPLWAKKSKPIEISIEIEHVLACIYESFLAH
jgi:hypothetical protein